MPIPGRRRTSLADHTQTMVYDLAHLHQALGDDRRLTPLLGGDARIGSRRVDERDDRQPKLGGKPHLEKGFTVTLRMRTAEMAGRPLGQVLPLLVADEHDLDVVEVGQTGDDGLSSPRRDRRSSRNCSNTRSNNRASGGVGMT